MYRWNQIFIASHKTFFILIGTFGNLNLLYIIFSTPKLRNKSSYLQSVQSAAHVACLVSSFLDVYLMLSDTQIPRDMCFQLIFPVVFCYCVQATIMFCILLDILLDILFPLAFRNIKDWKYAFVMSIGPCVFGVAVVVFGFENLDESSQYLCNPTPVLPPSVRSVTFNVIAVINTLSLLLFIVLIFIFRKRGKKRSYFSKVMTHLQVSAALFIVSTYFSTFATTFLIFIGYAGYNSYDLIANLSISAMFAYSHTFYVIIWRSPEYRSRFIGLYVKNAGTRVVSLAPSRIRNPSVPSEK